ncbi:MAG: pilus assembly protein [Chloroflexota bacterium]|nr:pilus assembly protein [Chloroflexota bacterium]
MLFRPREEGQGLVEYALILVLVALIVIVILAILGPTVGNIFSNVVNLI